jgi:ribosome-associated protein
VTDRGAAGPGDAEPGDPGPGDPGPGDGPTAAAASASGAPPASAPGPAGLVVAPGVVIPVGELQWRFSGAGGPGGQHVNTANTRAEVRFDVAASPTLPGWARRRIVDQLGPVVAVAASDRRSQLRNRELAMERLTARLAAALAVTRPRRPTRPTAGSQQRRLAAKRRRGDVKRRRRNDARGGDPD